MPMVPVAVSKSMSKEGGVIAAGTIAAGPAGCWAAGFAYGCAAAAMAAAAASGSMFRNYSYLIRTVEQQYRRWRKAVLINLCLELIGAENSWSRSRDYALWCFPLGETGGSERDGPVLL